MRTNGGGDTTHGASGTAAAMHCSDRAAKVLPRWRSAVAGVRLRLAQVCRRWSEVIRLDMHGRVDGGRTGEVGTGRHGATERRLLLLLLLMACRDGGTRRVMDIAILS